MDLGHWCWQCEQCDTLLYFPGHVFASIPAFGTCLFSVPRPALYSNLWGKYSLLSLLFPFCIIYISLTCVQPEPFSPLIL